MSEPTGNGIRCRCGGPTRVTDSRPTASSIRRRRKCLVCGERLTTWETTRSPAQTVEPGTVAERVLLNLRSAHTIIGEMIVGLGEDQS